MSFYADDVIGFQSVMKIAYNFLTGRDYLNKRRQKEKKKIISVALGFPDLVFAANALPVFPIRMEKFKINLYLMALNSATNLFGWDLTTKLLGIARQLDFLKIVEKVLVDVINATNEKYNEMYDLGVENGASSQLCYGINALYGMHKARGEDLDANLNFAMRCGKWNKFSESLRNIVPNQIWVDVPSKDIINEEKRLELMKENIKDAINELEKITGNYISDSNLKKQFRIGNQVKRFYKTILYEISNSDFYPCNPATFAEILALLTISFQDYNSNAQRYLENMSQLVTEMRRRIDKHIGMDVSRMPRILITPMFGGWEPVTHEIVYELGGRTLYADWDILGLLEEIPVSEDSDPIEDYAQFLLDASIKGIGCDNEALSNSYLSFAKKMDIDGFIFNKVFGCPTISNFYEIMERKIKSELNIPAIVINFRKIGEDIQEVKTELGGFMEIFT
jgi:benzoyl-CoA reductase/2-hydroxyglutaryl-CoA dehydratase subunit BcrC/BadD/HgdB